MLKIWNQYWFLIMLCSLFGLGMVAHRELAPLAESRLLRDLVVSACMFLMALPLEASAIGNTLRRPAAVILSTVISFGFLPVVAWLATFTLSSAYGGGLIVTAVTPCTMASATVWTRKAGGNDAVATVVTVVTNLVCFLITPTWLYLLTGRESTDSSRQFGPMVLSLATTVVTPVVLAQLVRLVPRVAQFAEHRRWALGLTAQWCILFMVLVGAIRSGDKLAQANSHLTGWMELAYLVPLLVGLHLLAFWAGFTLARGCGLARPDQLAVGFSGSQKTLMVGMTIALEQGFSVLPMVIYHVGQLFVDTLLADWLRRSNSQENAGINR